MITIDKKDELYRYLSELGVDDVDAEYETLAKLGRFKKQDIRAYYAEQLRPSIITEDIDEEELANILDYFLDIKKIKSIPKSKEKELLKLYKEKPSKELFNLIFSNRLKDVLYLAINYKSTHEKVDLQDVVQTANMGLIEAIEHYKLSKALNLEDYITYWVSQKIKEEFEEKNND